MAQFEVLALDKTNSRARAPGSGDSYLMPRSLAVGGETVTASAPVLDLSQSWNASGVTFTGIKFNVTDTASATGSLLMDLQVGGVSKFSVAKDGRAVTGLTVPSSATPTMWFSGNSANTGIGATYGPGFVVNGTMILYVSTSGIYSNNKPIDVGTSYFTFSGTTNLYADAANTLAQRNGVNAQTSRLYGTYTDASNYRRLTKTMSAAGVAEIKPEGAGTGATGNVLYISGLPTSNPGPGILWNNLGIVNVGT